MNYNTRDQLGIAVKSTYCEVTEEVQVGTTPENLKWEEVTECREIFKDPITDDGQKKSAKGLLAVYKDEYDGEYYLKDQVTWDEANNCELKPVFKNGKLLIDTSLKEIRERLLHNSN